MHCSDRGYGAFFSSTSVSATFPAMGVALLDLRFSGYEGASRVRKPYDFSSFLTIFSLLRGLGRDEEATDGTVSGTRWSA